MGYCLIRMACKGFLELHRHCGRAFPAFFFLQRYQDGRFVSGATRNVSGSSSVSESCPVIRPTTLKLSCNRSLPIWAPEALLAGNLCRRDTPVQEVLNGCSMELPNVVCYLHFQARREMAPQEAGRQGDTTGPGMQALFGGIWLPKNVHTPPECAPHLLVQSFVLPDMQSAQQQCL